MDVRERHPGRNDTMKKKYIKPAIIDLSIEGMTGFGYGVLSANCVDGSDFAAPSCNNGYGVNSSCSGGLAPTSECSDGGFPSDIGTSCFDGNSANGRVCVMGPTVSGYNANCEDGGSGMNVDNSPDCLNNGNTANYCMSGNSNVGGFS